LVNGVEPDKVCFQLVVMVMVNPGFPQHFTNLFQLLPMSLFKVESTNNFHCDQCFMMADLDSALLTVMISSNNSHGSERAHEQNRVIQGCTVPWLSCYASWQDASDMPQEVPGELQSPFANVHALRRILREWSRFLLDAHC
jgi:hypothetical protein